MFTLKRTNFGSVIALLKITPRNVNKNGLG